MDEESNINSGIVGNQKLADDAAPLCPNCLEPCDPLAKYCPNCASNEAINPLAPYMPLESVRFEAGLFAKLWRKIWNSNRALGTKCMYTCLFVLFMPLLFLLLITCASRWFFFQRTYPQDRDTQ